MDWPVLGLDDLPTAVREILRRVSRTAIGADGYLRLMGDVGTAGRVPVAQTLWNKLRSLPGDRLIDHIPWGIVLHWYGDRDSFDRTIEGYLRGFDSIRKVETYYTRTSAHFLVGDAIPSAGVISAGSPIGIIQTQVPDLDGTPYVASHLRNLDYQAHRDRRQYFVRALYQLGYEDPLVHSLLQEIYDGRRLDPNMRTLAVEISGAYFESHEDFPSEQKIANVISVVWALMKRYGVAASGLMGHNEIQLGKADPGKKFMALIRYLIGVKALVEDDGKMKSQVFGQFLDGGGPREAVKRYFSFVRNYLVLADTPRRVYEWEALSKYWLVFDAVSGGQRVARLADEFCAPIAPAMSRDRYTFLEPINHEGDDLTIEFANRRMRRSRSTQVRLVAEGECIYTGGVSSCGHGASAIFRHRQADGAEILTVYGHLQDMGDLKVGARYPMAYRVGTLQGADSRCEDFLHFAIAYGATWETDLKHRPTIPPNAGATWIKQRYLPPMDYLNSRLLSG